MVELNYKESSEKLAKVLFPEFNHKIKVRAITGTDSNKILETVKSLTTKDNAYCFVDRIDAHEYSFWTSDDLVGRLVGYAKTYNTSDIVVWYPEMFMHPNEQRHIVKKCIEKLIENRPDHDIDIIFVTDSAIVLSDVPDGNVTYIDSFERYLHMGPGHRHSLNTFAANLYDIYVNSLMDENKGAIGDYAAGIINKGVDLSKEGNLSYEDKILIATNIADDFLSRTFNRIESKK